MAMFRQGCMFFHLSLILFSGGCYVGQVHCDEPDPCSDMEYFPLYDGTRNVNFDDVDNFCDASNHNYTSHDWHGPNWYR